VIILPAIDLLDGACVRLYRGRYDRAVRYGSDPVAVARRFEQAGARWLHLVDLDAARAGPGQSEGQREPRQNRAVIGEIRRAVRCRLQVGGGVRVEADVEELLDLGADRLVVGTALVREPEAVALWCARWGTGSRERCPLWGAIDAAGGRVRVSGWEQETAVEDTELARRAAGLGLGGVVYTSIRRDGTLEGPDLVATNRVASSTALPVILSGGIAGAGDVRAVERGRHPGVQGLILGKALYEGRVDLAELFRRYPQTDRLD
jgi:phosphoribosylformimino-5-aminoimidazole carboxamide ribotide isomerase